MTAIKGYRTLTTEEINLINRSKELGEDVEALIKVVGERPNVDGRWLNIAKTDLQKGFMSLNRSIANPDNF